MVNESLKLAGEFPAASHEAWMEAVNKILKGRDFGRVLVNEVGDGITTQPLYTRADEGSSQGMPGLAPYRRGGSAAGNAVDGWDIRQRHGLADPAAVNEAVLGDLQRGVTSIELVTVGLEDQASMTRALEGVLLEMATIGLMASDSGVKAANVLLQLLDSYDHANSELAADLGCDPIARLADHGTVGEPIADALAAVAALAVRVDQEFAAATTVRASAVPFAQAGASPADELGFLVSSAVAYLRALTDAGLSIDAALQQVLLNLSVGTDQFLDIAKLRAARQMIGRIANASGASSETALPKMQTVTSVSVLTQRDPWVNMLRTTVGTAASALGGADIVTVTPFDALLGQPEALGLRVARNTQLILQQESNLHRVVDPAGGSWYVEYLTEQLALAGWAAFQEIEAQGGVVAALESGWAQARIGKTWEAQRAAIGKRKRAITGVSEFPDITEEPVTRAAFAVGAPPPEPDIEPLPTRRLAEPWEDLRSRMEDHGAANGASIFLANLGTPAVHTARATFAKNLFEAAGIVAVSNDGFASAAEAATAFSASGATLAILCSDDATYAASAVEAAAALKAAGCQRLFLAGAPGDQRDAYEAAGIDAFIHLGADVLSLLEEAAALVAGSANKEIS